MEVMVVEIGVAERIQREVAVVVGIGVVEIGIC